jgi:Ser/Thr protein kinase RdoA (MazF antagonist)
MRGEAEAVVGKLLGVRPLGVTGGDAAGIARRLYGIDGDIEPLRSERDQNFRIRAGGRNYILKLSHPAEDRAVTMLQTAALAHVAVSDPALPIPHIVPTRDGELAGLARVAGDAHRVVRLFTYLPGTLLHEVAADASLLFSLGAAAARLDAALQGFAHPDTGPALLWDLTRLPRVRPLLEALEGDPGREVVLRMFDAFERRAASRLAQLRAGFTHHDLNPHNVLAADGTVSGILDFGDMTRAPLVCDLAIAAAYHLGTGPGAFDGATACVAGYHAAMPLTDEELAILPVLMGGRLAMTVTITQWRAERDPDNAPYILRNNPNARVGLAVLDAEGLDAVAVRFGDACRGSRAA